MLLESVEPRPRVGGGGQAGLDRLWSHPALLGELAEVLERLDVDARDVTMPVRLPHGQHVPIHAHARYTRNEILASFGHSVLTRPLEWREGVRYDLDAQTDLFAFTLQKAERDFSPTTMYRDYAISRDLVHWESQSTLTEGTPTARRYMQHATAGTSILLFARPTKNERAFTCLGMATHVEHRGERPIAFVWRLDQPMLESFFAMARADVA